MHPFLYPPQKCVAQCSNGFPPQVPKIIHQTYKSLEKIPEHWKSSREAWIRFHPVSEGWEYKFWSDEDLENLVRNDFPEYLEFFMAFPKAIQKVDFARVLILKKYGGFYSDLDFEPTQSLEKFLSATEWNEKTQVLLCKSANFGCVTNAFMASVPEADFWDHVIQEIQHRISNQSLFWIAGLRVIYTTGPGMLNYMYFKYSTHPDHKDKLLVMPKVVSCSICDPKPYVREGYFLKVLQGSSWISTGDGFWLWWHCKWPWVVFFLLLILVIILLFWQMVT